MITQHAFGGKTICGRLESGLSAGVVLRSAVVGRRVVAKATKVPARGQQGEIEGLIQIEASTQSRVKRSALASRRIRISRTTKSAQSREDGDNDDSQAVSPHPGGVDESEEDDCPSGSRAAALRDATATASTSGHTHLEPLPQGALLQAVSSQLLHQHRTVRREELVQGKYMYQQEDEEDLGRREQGSHGGEPQLMRPQEQQQKQQQQQQQAHPLPLGVTPERDRDIHNELRGCEHWRDVLDVVEDEATQLSLRTAVQALTRLNTLTRGLPAARRELTQLPAFQMLSHLLHSQVPLMNNVQLSNTLYALAQLQVQVPEDTLQAYLTASEEKADTFYARDIATLFAAAAALRYSPRQHVLDELGFRATGLLLARTFDSRSIGPLLHSCALLGYKNPILAQAAAQMLAAPGVVASLAPQGVANGLWGLGRMGTYHPAAVEAALAAFTAAPLSYKPQECANLLWALTAFRHHPTGRFAVFAKSLLSRMDSLRGADLATLLYALAFFNVAPGQQVLAKVAARVGALISTSGAASKATAADASQADSGAGSSTSTSTSGGINAVELCNMYWGLALLGEVEAPLFAQLEEQLVVLWERGLQAGESLPDSLKRMMFQAFLASRMSESSSRRPHSIPPLVLDACKRAWTGTIVEVAESQSRRRSVDHVAGLLVQLKVVHDRRRLTGDGLGIIDLALKAGPERYVALQVLEDVHYCANDNRQLLGTTVIQRQLLEKNGWEVRYLNYRDLERLAPELQLRFLADLLRAMGLRVRGAPAAVVSRAAGRTEGVEPQEEQEEERPSRAVITPLKRRKAAGR